MTDPIDNPAQSRFELHMGSDVAIAAYELSGSTMTFTHTEVPKHLEGQGVGSTLAAYALDQARARHLTVVPRCPFIHDFITKHPEYQELVKK